MSLIVENISNIKSKIGEAAARVGRDPEGVLLLAVSKTIAEDRIRDAAEAGLVHFGENRVQEARGKIPHLPADLVWHLVGHLQSNKAKYCPDLFQWIHSIDSVPLAREVARRYVNRGRSCRALIQVSVSGEEAKFGCSPERVEEILEALLEEEGVEPAGLMTMPPFFPDPEDSRPFFRALRDLRDGLVAAGYPLENLRELSMGMTGDFEVAVEEGATIIRIGTAIFGARGG